MEDRVIMDRVILFGIGNNYNLFMRYADISSMKIVALVDSCRAGENINNMTIVSPEMIGCLEFDYIYVLPTESDDIVLYLTKTLGILHERVLQPYDINKIVMLGKLGRYNYVMITTDTDYLNYPYMSLRERNDFTMRVLLPQKEEFISFDSNEETDYSNVNFIIRDHCYIQNKALGVWDYLKKKYCNARWIVILSDMCDGDMGRFARMGIDYLDDLKKDFEFVITYHAGDAKKYRLLHKEQTYPYSIGMMNGNAIMEFDVLFVGNAKQRLGLIHDVYLTLVENGIRCRFYINGVNSNDQLANSDIIYNHMLSYENYLKEVQKCRCILEVCQVGNESTYRYDEAVVNNKKLLFNDPSCMDRKYFNKEFMHYFQNAADLDIDWIRRDISVDYKYENDFSPNRFLKYIDDILINNP